MMFVVMAIEHGRDNGNFLQHQGVRKPDGGPHHAELDDGAAGSGGLNAGIEGLLRADSIEREVVIAAWCLDGSSPQSFGGGGLMRVARHDVYFYTSIYENSGSKKSDGTGPDNNGCHPFCNWYATYSVHDYCEWFH